MSNKRRSGILLPISCLPSPHGIGCFSREAYEFVDFLTSAGQSYWQILPLGPTGYGDSPYQSFSTYAGNPYFIDLTEFVERGWLSMEEVDAADMDAAADADALREDIGGADPGASRYVDYGWLYTHRFDLLRAAYHASRSGIDSPPASPAENAAAAAAKDSVDGAASADPALTADFADWCEANAWWLEDYALYTAVKDRLGGISLMEWPEPVRRRDPAVLEEYRSSLADELQFVRFCQYFFDRQWRALKAYANDRGIEIIGDLPIYVALDSADTWANPELFQLDDAGVPTAVAGCPPDAFAATGQLWGNPLYRWDYHRSTGYDWWMKRLTHCLIRYDVVRIDHFRGFDEFYSIPWGDPTAEFGHWEPGPGYDFIGAVKEAIPGGRIIAEDLGYLTPTVIGLLKKSGFPGMKVLQFAFDSREESDYLPHNYTANSVVYTGTHDNETMRGWCDTVNRTDYAYARRYLGYIPEERPETAFIRAALMSVSDTCVIPLQDYLGLGHEARINTPSTVGGNWTWRLLPGECTDELAEEIKTLSALYGRTV